MNLRSFIFFIVIYLAISFPIFGQNGNTGQPTGNIERRTTNLTTCAIGRVYMDTSMSPAKLKLCSSLNTPLSIATESYVDNAISGITVPVTSVFGRTGDVVAVNGDYDKTKVGLGNVDNISDLDKPISTATQGYVDNQIASLPPIITNNATRYTIPYTNDENGNLDASNMTYEEGHIIITLNNLGEGSSDGINITNTTIPSGDGIGQYSPRLRFHGATDDGHGLAQSRDWIIENNNTGGNSSLTISHSIAGGAYVQKFSLTESGVLAVPTISLTNPLVGSMGGTGINTTDLTGIAQVINGSWAIVPSKSQRVTTGSIGSAATALVTLTWASPFFDTNYTPTCSVLDSTASSLSLSVQHIESISASAITVRILNNAAVAAITGTLMCIAIHD